MIRVELPAHLRTLARIKGSEIQVDVAAPVTPAAIMDAIEATFPMLVGTLRDHVTRERRPLVRFFACGRDVSHEPLDRPLPEAISNGGEPFLIIGAIAGG